MPEKVLAAIRSFLLCDTPESWIEAALREQDTLLIDHANCEKKAAGTAISLLYKYIDQPDLLHKMSKLAREELRHFEQVMDIMAARGVDYVHVTASRYAAGLHELIRKQEPFKLIDTLIVGAYIEARSCERFAAVAPYLDEELQSFYMSLLKSESRHYQDYISLAKRVAGTDISDRIAAIGAREKELIESEDEVFRFHSGAPVRRAEVVV